MESIRLEKGQVFLMEDHLLIENDGAINRKWRNIVVYSLIFLVIFFYLVSSYNVYMNDPRQFPWFRFLTQMVVVVVLIIPTAIKKVFRYSTVNKVPYNQIKKHEPSGTLFNWNGALNLYLLDNNIRTLSFKGDDMRSFKLLLEQKL